MTEMVVYGFSIGATAVMIFVGLVLTDLKKARRPIFIINFMCLVCQCIRNIWITGNICAIVAYGFTQDFLNAVSQYPKSSYVPTSVAFAVFDPIFYGLLFASLILQARTVFSAQPLTRRVVTVLLSLFALTIEAFWITFQVFWIGGLLQTIQQTTWEGNILEWLYKVVQSGVTAFVGIVCIILVAKLFMVIRWRYKMRIRRFGPFHVLIIMFGQCLIIPRK